MTVAEAAAAVRAKERTERSASAPEPEVLVMLGPAVDEIMSVVEEGARYAEIRLRTVDEAIPPTM